VSTRSGAGDAMTLADAMRPAMSAAEPEVFGRVTAVVGLSVAVSGIKAAVGDLVSIGERVPAEVVAIDARRLTCLPLGPLAGISAGARVRGTGGPARAARCASPSATACAGASSTVSASRWTAARCPPV
jgi:flagellar biosynthesis/type III secretory pathway ATPase